jgi:hypothetical protein
MKKLLLVAVVATTFNSAFAQPADEAASREKIAKDLLDIEMALERVRVIVPPSFDVASERKAIESLARKAKLGSIDVKLIPGTERFSLDDGTPLPLVMNRLEITGRDAYDSFHFFLSMLRHRSRPVGIESLRLDVKKEQSVRFIARLRYPSWATVPDENAGVSVAALRRKLSRNRDILDKTVQTLVQLKETGKATDALAAFTKEIEEHSIALTGVRIDDDISITGLALGSAARAKLPASLKQANLRAGRLEWTPAGACHAFVVSAKSETTDESESFTPGREVFDGDVAAFCHGEPVSPARRIVARGPASTDDKSFFLRLRNVDLVDVFFVINDLAAENFVVDQDVKGRVDLDIFQEATLEDALSALRGEGLVIGSRPLRRVSRATPAVALADKPASGDPINVSVRNAEIADILCLLGNVTKRELSVPRGLHGRVSVFATELPAVAILEELLPKSSDATMNPCSLERKPLSRFSMHRLTFEQMAADDLRIAGIAHVGDVWKVYADVPTIGLMPLEAEQRLFDGSVKSIGPKGVTVASRTKGVIDIPFVP